MPAHFAPDSEPKIEGAQNSCPTFECGQGALGLHHYALQMPPNAGDRRAEKFERKRNFAVNVNFSSAANAAALYNALEEELFGLRVLFNHFFHQSEFCIVSILIIPVIAKNMIGFFKERSEFT